MGASQSQRKLVPNRPPPRVPLPSPSSPTTPTSPKDTLVPPDGGWGWMVVLGTILTVFFFPAMTVAFGVLFSERLETLGAGPMEFTIIGNTLSTVWSFVALLIAPVTELFGYRKVTFVGGLLAFLTMALSAHASSLVSFTLAYSVLGGLAGSLSAFNGFVIIPHYFTRRKGLANGIVSSASALGKIAMAPLVRLLLDFYGYTWACLLVGALSLHTCVAGMLYHPPQWHMVPAEGGEKDLQLSSRDVAITENGIVEENGRLRTTQPPPTKANDEEDENILFVMPMPNTPVPPSRRDDEVVLFSRQTPMQDRRGSERGVTKVDSTLSLMGSLPLLAPIQNKVYTKDKGDETNNCCDDFLIVKVFQMLKYSLLKDPYFHLVAWPNAMALTAYINSLYALPGYVTSLGYSNYQGAFAISVFSFSEAVMRLVIAVLSDMDWFPLEPAYTTGFLLAAVTTSVMTLIPSYEWILCCQAVNGFAMSLISVLLIHVILRYNPVEDYAQIIGFFSILNGMMLLLGGSLIGYITEHVSSHAQFGTMGCIFLASGLVWLGKLMYDIKICYSKVPPASH